MSQKITDKNGTTFILDLNIGCALRIQEATGVNILADTSFISSKPGGMQAALPELEADPIRLALVLEAACPARVRGPKALEGDVPGELGSPRAWTSAYASLTEAICDFFPDRADRIRKMVSAIRQGRTKTDQANEAAVEAGKRLLDGIDVDAMVKKLIAQAEAASSTTGSESGNSPES